MQHNKGLNLSMKTKIIMTITITLFTMIVMTASYKYGFTVGNLNGYEEGIGTSGVCEHLEKEMYGDYCQINQESTYRHYIECSWGQYITYGEREYKLMNFDPRMIFMQCKRSRVEMIN